MELAPARVGRGDGRPCWRFGVGPVRNAFNPPGVTRGFGWLGDLLAAPAARWDAAWYLVIAHYGYRPDLGAFTSSRTAFFPLYPLCLSAISHLGVPPMLAGVLLSSGALALALYGIHRLTTLELARAGAATVARARSATTDHASGGEVARLAVILTAFAPMAFFFSAVYSESLYLALSVGVFLCARQGRWAWVAVLGALAAATRSAGVVLLLPAAMLYLYGPREDRAPGLPQLARRGGRSRSCTLGCTRLRRDVLWLGLVPAGLGIYMAYLALYGGDALMPFHAQDVWSRHFAGPYVGVWDGAKAAFEGARQLLSQGRHVYFPAAGGSPDIDAGHNLMLLAFLLRGRADGRGRAADAAARLRRVRDRRAGAAAVLPGGVAAADVAAALSGGAVPAEHLAGGVAGRAPTRAQCPCSWDRAC